MKPLQDFTVELGTQILVKDGSKVSKGQKIGQREQHSSPIICEKPGYVKYEDLVEGISTQKESNKQTGAVELVVKQHRGETSCTDFNLHRSRMYRARRYICHSFGRDHRRERKAEGEARDGSCKAATWRH